LAAACAIEPKCVSTLDSAARTMLTEV
jgi:hypothetical protein